MTVDRPRWVIRAGFAVTATLIAAGLIKLLTAALIALRYRYDLDYGEGIVWQQAVNIAAGRGYGPLGILPAIVYHYPPVYHLCVEALARLSGLDAVVVGRAVSTLAAFGVVALAARLTFAAMTDAGDRSIRLLAAGLAGALCVNSPTLLVWSTMMRVDLLSSALTLAGLWWTAQALRGRPSIILATAAFTLAVYTKQTAIFAPAAAFGVLLIADRRIAWRFAAWSIAFALAALVLLSWLTDGGFLRHVLLYNVNQLDMSRLKLLAQVLQSQMVTLALAAIGSAIIWQRLRPIRLDRLRLRVASDPVAATQLLLLANLLVRVVTLPMILKSGSSDNYLIDLFIAAAMLTAEPIRHVATAARTGAEWPRLSLAALVLVALPLQSLAVPVPYDGDYARSGIALARLEHRLAHARKPIVADSMVLLRRAGKDVVLEPAIVTELSHAGMYDEAAYVVLIHRHAFAGFVTFGGAGTRLFNERYSPAVRAAMAADYPRIEQYGNLLLHLPVNEGPAALPRS